MLPRLCTYLKMVSRTINSHFFINLKGGRRKSIQADQETIEIPPKNDRRETFMKTVQRQKANHFVLYVIK